MKKEALDLGHNESKYIHIKIESSLEVSNTWLEKQKQNNYCTSHVVGVEEDNNEFITGELTLVHGYREGIYLLPPLASQRFDFNPKKMIS